MAKKQAMKISILTPDLSHNCLGRAYILGKILQRHYDVEIVGPVFGDGIWEPLRNDTSIMYKGVDISDGSHIYSRFRELAGMIDGKVLYAQKPLFTSYGIGLLKKLSSKKALVIDVDDWQFGLVKAYRRKLSFRRQIAHLSSSAVQFYGLSSYWNNLFWAQLIRFADEITVSSHFLKKAYGGLIVWHARNTDDMNPDKYNPQLFRKQYGIEQNKKIVMFLGTPKVHKGIEDLINSLELIKDPGVVLTIVGINYDKAYCVNLINDAERKLGADRLIHYGLQPFGKIPEFLSMADVVVLPQKRNSATIGQVPAKIFDAMAMAKPSIATNVSCLPEILEDCGWIVEPERPDELAGAIRYVLEHPEESKQKGQKARERCKALYSYDAMEEVLCGLFEKFR